MKPTKKKNFQTKKVNDSSTPKIDSYFKAAAKQLNLVLEPTSDTWDEKTIYIEAAKKKLRGKLTIKIELKLTPSQHIPTGFRSSSEVVLLNILS